MSERLCRDDVGLRRNEVMDRRASGTRGETGKPTEEHDGEVEVRHGCNSKCS